MSSESKDNENGQECSEDKKFYAREHVEILLSPDTTMEMLEKFIYKGPVRASDGTLIGTPVRIIHSETSNPSPNRVKIWFAPPYNPSTK